MKFRSLLLGLILGALSSIANAATIYVSNTATNGFAVGADSGAGTTKNAPWLTLSYAVTTAGAGDIIVVNNGEYTNTGSLTPTVAGLTIRPATRYGVVISSSSGTNSNLLVNVAATGITLEHVILDGGYTKTANVTYDTSNNVAVTFIGTRFKGARTHCMTSMTRVTSLIMYGDWSCDIYGDSGTTQNGINGVPTQVSSWLITDGTVNGVANPVASTAFNGILLSPTAALTATVNNVTVNLQGLTGAGDARGIYSEGTSTLTLSNNTINYGGSTAPTFYGIIIPNDAVDTSTVSVFNNRVIASAFGDNTNIGIQVGNNAAPAVSNKVVVARLDGNYTKNTNHGILMGYLSGAKAYRNEVENAKTAFVLKTTTNGSGYSSNLAHGYPFTDGALRARGDVNGFMANNDVHVTSLGALDSIPIMVDDSPEASNSGTKIYSNSITSEVTLTECVRVDNGDSATFKKNNYKAVCGFRYQANNYNSIAGWRATEPTATDYLPGYAGWPTPVTAGDFRLTGDSPLRGKGQCVLATGCAYNTFGNTKQPNPPNIGMW